MRIAACFSALAALALALIPLGAAEAASRITTKDGNVIVGDIESLKDNFYTIRTYGAMRVPAQSVDRIEPAETAAAPASGAGPGARSSAPSAAATTSGALRLAGSNTIGAELAPRLLEALRQEERVGGFRVQLRASCASMASNRRRSKATGRWRRWPATPMTKGFPRTGASKSGSSDAAVKSAAVRRLTAWR